ncbi:hypothetical protein M8V95_004361 [Salmonella enterica]|nr:hypothetical protein [Salmonella enterica]EJF5830803.1 hypothetical protein [Salmonella enterica]EJF5858448.1 hypothetical protein [Salmonella enterica]EJF5949569.1 hypothetical protein [Salmonella enterica]EJF6160139.1 hypothetical protein [Salmonella enterica]
MTDSDVSMIDMIIAHRKAVEAFTAVSALIPIDDELHALMGVLSDNLEVTFNRLYPSFRFMLSRPE